MTDKLNETRRYGVRVRNGDITDEPKRGRLKTVCGFDDEWTPDVFVMLSEED